MSGSRAVRFLKNAAPQLVGFGVGLGAKLYVDKYEMDPPEIVANNSALMYVHDGLIDVRHLFHQWGQSWAGKGTAIDISETLAAAKTAFESDQKSECADYLKDILVSGIGVSGSIAGQCVDYMDWLADVVPSLHKTGHITDIELLVILTNTVLQHPITKHNIITEYQELVVDLPIKILHSENSNSPAAIIFALTVLTVAATNEITLLDQKRLERKQLPWYSRMFSSNPTSPIADLIIKDPITLQQIMACLASGVTVPVYLLSCISHNNKGNLKELISHGFIEASSAYLAGASSIGEENKELDQYSIDIVQILEKTLSENPNAINRVPYQFREKVADTVFRTAAEFDGYADQLRCCINVLLQMVDSNLITAEWLAKKGVVPLVTQTLSWHGRDKSFVVLLSEFAFRILNDDAARSHVSESTLVDLQQAIVFINNMPESSEASPEYLLEGDGETDDLIAAAAELKDENIKIAEELPK